MNYVKEVSIDPSVLTDHKTIFLSINTAKSKDVKRILENEPLTDLQFWDVAENIIVDCSNKANLTNNLVVNWELMKYKITAIAIRTEEEIAKTKEKIKIKLFVNICDSSLEIAV